MSILNTNPINGTLPDKRAEKTVLPHVSLTRPSPQPRPLSPRAQDCLKLVLEGKSDKEIAARLELTVGTAKVYVSNMYKALGVHTRYEILGARIKELENELAEARSRPGFSSLVEDNLVTSYNLDSLKGEFPC
jgi:DNA-binding CsgD family transcriptional regulator